MHTKDLAIRRHHLKRFTREFFSAQGYYEVDTPVITRCPGTEVHLQYFETSWIDHGGTANKRFLRSSPELHMKRVMASGVEKIFQLGPCFRNNGELSDWHNPEFFMLEWYQAGQSYQGLIDETERYLRTTADSMGAVTGINPAQILPQRIKRLTVCEAFREFVGLDLKDLDPDLAQKARSKGVVSVQVADDFETAFFKILIEKVEPALAKLGACVLFDYPPSQAALAKVEGDKACRFEFYVGRVELCNGFFELTGEKENRARIAEAMIARKAAGHCEVMIDEDFFSAMAKFTKPCAGNALGFDRWLSLLNGGQSLHDAILFTGV